MGQLYKIVSLDNIATACYAGVTSSIFTFIDRNNPITQNILYNMQLGRHLYKKRIVWVGNLSDVDGDTKTNLYNMHMPYYLVMDIPSNNYVRFIVNVIKKQYVDIDDVSTIDYNTHTVQINPLPLLTSQGFGRDPVETYYDDTLIGFWAGDILYSTNDVPPHNYKQLSFHFKHK